MFLGQTGDGEVGPAAATLPGYLSDDGASVVCPTPATMIPAGRHAVRLSFNDQQFAAPAGSLGTEAVEFFANGPHLAMRRTVVHGSETVGEARVEVELIGDFVLNVTVDVEVTFGGSSVLPGESEAEGYQPRPHVAAVANGTRWSDRDFEVPIRRLSWSPTDPTRVKSVPVIIRDDRIFETALEALTITLRNATNADVDETRASTVVTIADDDAKVLVAARPHVAVYRATGATTAHVPVDVVAGETALGATVAYAVGGGTMVNGTMYEHASGTLTWAPHDSGTKFVEVRLFWENIAGGGVDPGRDADARAERAGGPRGRARGDASAARVRGADRGVPAGNEARDVRRMDSQRTAAAAADAAVAAAPVAAAAGRVLRRRAVRARADDPTAPRVGPGHGQARHSAHGGGGDVPSVRVRRVRVRRRARQLLLGGEDDLSHSKSRGDGVDRHQRVRPHGGALAHRASQPPESAPGAAVPPPAGRRRLLQYLGDESSLAVSLPWARRRFDGTSAPPRPASGTRTSFACVASPPRLPRGCPPCSSWRAGRARAKPSR